MHLPNVEVSELRYFHAVATAGSFAEGARSCGVSAPAVSKAIKKLEDNLGATLFDRSARRVAMTAAGEMLLVHAEHVLRSLQGLAEAVRSGTETLEGELFVGGTEEFAASALPRAVVALARAHPGLTIRTYLMGPDEITRRLTDGSIDLGLCAGGRPTPATLRVDPLIASPLSLVCGRGHPLHGQESVEAEVLSQHPFVVPSFFGELRANDRYPEDAPPRKVGASAELVQMAIQMTIDGGFVGYFPDVMIRCHLNHEELHRLRAPFEVAHVELVAMRRRGPARACALDALCAELQTALQAALVRECAV